MATYTSNYGWTKPSGSDNVDISVLNNNLDDQDSTIHDAFLNMAPPFSESSTYAVDDIVLYGTGLYKCHTAVVTPGSWTGSTNWQVYKLSEGGSGGGTSNYNQLTNKPQINSVELSGNKTAAQLGLMASDGVVANPTGQTTGTLTALEVGGTKYAVPSGGTSDYTDLTNKPSINGVELSGNKTTSALGITASEVGAIASTDKGANGGVATLGNDGIVPSNQLPTMFDGDYNSLTNKPILGTAAAKDVPSAGNASLTEVVIGSDSRLSDDRNAKDVYSWAKAATKPTYTASEVGAIPSTDKGANGGVAELDANGLVPVSQLPSYVDDVLEGTAQNVTETGAGTYSATGFILSGESSPCVPESGKTYVDTTSNIQYRWTGTGTNFVSMGSNLALGETSSTAYRGDRGKTAYDHSQTQGNPHGTTKSDVGLGNVPNVSTNNQTPTFTQASTRNNIASGEKLSVILGKVQKFFNDLKTVAFSGSYTDLSNKPSIPTKTSDLTNDSNFVSDANYVHTDNNFTASEKTKLAGIASGAEANVQANWSQTNTSADDFIKNKPSLATVATSGSYADLSNTPTIPAAQVNSDWNASSGVAEILNKPSSYKPSSHLHGNIQNGGTLQTTDVAIANGDKLVVTDSSNSAKIARTSATFDGTTTTQALSKKGTFETFSKFSGSYTDLTDKPIIPTSASGISYDNTDSGLTATDVQGAVDELAESYPADKVMMSDGVTSVEDAISTVDTYNLTLTGFASPIKFQRIGRVVYVTYNGNVTNLPAGSLSFSEVVPEKYRPAESTSFYSVSAAGSYTPPIMLRFTSNGVIDGYNYRGAISASTSCRLGTISYIANS